MKRVSARRRELARFVDEHSLDALVLRPLVLVR
jgi:hypothetical protein